MQNINLNANSSENTEGTESCFHSECHLNVVEPAILRQEVIHLKQNVFELETILRTKDGQLESLHRDKDRLSDELKRQQRCNRNLRQQLDDERYFYQREREHFNEELENRRISSLSNMTRYQKQQQRNLERTRDTLQEENDQLKKELTGKSGTTYNLCIKFLRMKHAKDNLRKKHDELQREHLRVMTEIMEKLDEAREELNIIVSEKFRGPLPLGKAKFLQIMQRNARLVHENATLKAQVLQLTKNFEKLRELQEKPKDINVDARIIAKLTMQSEKRNERSAKWLSSLKDVNAAVKLPTTSSSTNTNGSQLVDQSGDAKIISLIKSRNPGKLQKLARFGDGRRQSAPEISSKDEKTSSSALLAAPYD